MNSRTKIRIISFAAAAFLTAVGYAVRSSVKAADYRRYLSQVYAGNMSQLNESLYDISTELQKSVYASTPTQIGKIAFSLTKQSAMAKNALSSLPTGDAKLTTVNKFLSQVGDYASYLSAKATQGEEIGADERDNLIKLRDTARQISQSVDNTGTDYSSKDSWNSDIDGSNSSSGLGSKFSKTEVELEDYPTLLYDGPFSDGIDKKESKMLALAGAVDEETARRTAASALSMDAKALILAGAEEGKTPAYCFSGDNSYIAVTKNGGYVLYFRKSRSIGNTTLTYEQAVRLAQDYLNTYAQSFEGSFEQSYYFTDEGVCTVNFAYKQGNTICYTDLVKIGVAMDTGEIVLMEARGYIMNHYQRSLVTPKYTADEAKAAVSGNLTVKSVSLALIPTAGKSEVHCYELLCDGIDGQEVLVYMNVVTLQEEQIYIFCLKPTEAR